MPDNFRTDESGQDLFEYALLLSFICLAASALFIDTSKAPPGIVIILWISAGIAFGIVLIRRVFDWWRK